MRYGKKAVDAESSLLVLVLLATLGLLSACSSGTKRFPGSDEFNTQARQVVDHFERDGDSLKLRAAYFLLENAIYHFHQQTYFVDTVGNPVKFNVYDYPSKEAVQKAIDSLTAREKYRLFTIPIWDVDKLTAEDIISNIDEAFSAWRHKEWAKDVPFDAFLEFILPYKAYDEPLESWREKLSSELSWINDSLTDSRSRIEVCSKLNTYLGSRITFDWELGSQEFQFQSVSEMLTSGHGQCVDLVVLATCAMRAQGVPVAIDYVPHWAHRDAGHFWNVLLTGDGKCVDFGGAETNPGEINVIEPFCKAGKIFRYTYARQEETLAARKSSTDTVPGFFNRFNFKDVTREYISVGNIELSNLNVPPQTKYVYLCIYNAGEWKPIHWAEVEGSRATFTDMDDNEVLYLPVYFQRNQLIPAGEPFVYSKNHSLKQFDAANRTSEVNMRFYNKLLEAKIVEGLFKEGIAYSLSYWDGYWKRVDKKTVGKELSISFPHIPENALLRIESIALDDTYQRPFSIEQGQQVFY